MIFDVVGWFGSASGDVFNPLPPSRLLDTRPTGPTPQPPPAIGPSGELSVDVTLGKCRIRLGRDRQHDGDESDAGELPDGVPSNVSRQRHRT